MVTKSAEASEEPEASVLASGRGCSRHWRARAAGSGGSVQSEETWMELHVLHRHGWVAQRAGA